jgi:hypothetical protein
VIGSISAYTAEICRGSWESAGTRTGAGKAVRIVLNWSVSMFFCAEDDALCFRDCPNPAIRDGDADRGGNKIKCQVKKASLEEKSLDAMKCKVDGPRDEKIDMAES